MPGRSPVRIDRQINVTASGEGNIINIADFMADVTNNVNSKVDSSPVNPQAKEAIRLLMEEISTLTKAIPPEAAREMGSSMNNLSDELTKQRPRKDQVRLNLRTLKDALAGAGEVAGPSMTALEKLEDILN